MATDVPGNERAEAQGKLNSELLTWLARTLEVVDLFAVGGANQYVSGFFRFARPTSENTGTFAAAAADPNLSASAFGRRNRSIPAALCQEF
jgi:hypothetical protein